jgi:hypothetical protein
MAQGGSSTFATARICHYRSMLRGFYYIKGIGKWTAGGASPFSIDPAPSMTYRTRHAPFGDCPAITTVWNPTRHISVLTQYVHFTPGGYFQANPPDKSTDYFTVWLDYKF